MADAVTKAYSGKKPSNATVVIGNFAPVLQSVIFVPLCRTVLLEVARASKFTDADRGGVVDAQFCAFRAVLALAVVFGQEYHDVPRLDWFRFT